MDCRKYQIIKVYVSVFLAIAVISIAASPAWAVTDVYVTDIYTPTSLVALEDTTVTAELTNYGDAGYVSLSMYIDGAWAGTWQVYMDVSSWATVSITITGGLTAGYHTIEFCADYCRAEGWTWTGTPDLQLTDIYDPTSLTAGQDTTITARIDNIGNADAGPFYVDMYIDGQYAASWYYSSGLPAQYYSEPYVTITGGLVNGAHDIEFIADATSAVSESNESNNNRIESFTWTGGVPDLELTDIYDPTSLVSGEDTTITAKVTNIGYADADPFYLDVYVDGELVGYFDYSTGLPAWYYSEASVTFLGGLPSGDHDIQFISDSLDEVAESDETNNERTETWTWTAPTCTSDTGTGTGVLGDYKSHIDTCYVSSSDTYNLYDIARRANNNPHGHNGQMADDAAIETHYYNTGLMNDPDNNWNAGNQASGVDAHVYAGWTYDYLRSQLGRNGFDNQGSSMISTVESTDSRYYCPDNASWGGSQVVFCTVTSGHRSMAGALDIVAHEWGHAVTQYASNLNYANESGALNEAFSDWLGVTLGFAYNDPDWQQGENFNVNGNALRDLSNPPLYGQPDTYGGTYWYPITGCTPAPSNDYCGVHTNSGVPNKMFYLLSEGDTHNNITVQGIGVEGAIQIAYRANTTPNYWPANVTFQDALAGMAQAAEDIYGQNSNEANQAQNAWAAVGVGTLPVVVVNASTSGTVTGGGSKEWGATMTVTATPDTGYIFENWTEGGNVVSTSSSYSFTVDGDRTLVANFTSVPVISVSPTSYDFGSYYVGNPSPYKRFTVTNTGMSALTIQSVSITGTNALDFSYIDMCTGDILSPSENCLISVQFLPLSEGTKNAVLSIQSDDPVTPVLDAPLSGTGLNNPPVADPDGPYTGIEGQTITLEGSGSYDTDGTITLYEWDIDNNGTYDYSSSSSTQNHTYAQDGTYTVRLRVTDNDGATDEATTTADIPDTSPTADFTGSPTSGSAPLTVNFTNNSTGYDRPLSHEWDFDNDGIVDSTDRNPSYTYNTAGTYTVKLTVTDSDGSIDTLIRTNYITVTPPVYDLTITKTGSGSGTVTSSPAGIDCGTDCTETYTEGAVVTLSAIPDAGSYFTGWTGGGCSGTDDCTGTMNADTDITATFEAC